MLAKASTRKNLKSKVIVFRRKLGGYEELRKSGPKLCNRLDALIDECRRHPFKGTGKPEPLRGQLKGWWSRRINREHRLIYWVRGEGEAQVLEIAQCRYHH